jgi:hypothetical protein
MTLADVLQLQASTCNDGLMADLCADVAANYSFAASRNVHLPYREAIKPDGDGGGH